MKKSLYTALGIMALLFGACSQDSEPFATDEYSVSITINAPENFTRSNGSYVTYLQYAIYTVQDDGSVKQLNDAVEVPVSSYPLTLPLNGIKGQTYGILFWASAFSADTDANPYSIAWTEGTLEVDYSKAYANEEDMDAFCAYKTFTVSPDASLSVTLSRPFAQINIGTSVQPAEGTLSSITVADAPASVNLISGELSAETEEANFAFAPVPSNDVFPVEGYQYLASAYVLAPKSKPSPFTVTYSYKVADASPVSSSLEGVNLQANYRTNIYGVK